MNRTRQTAARRWVAPEIVQTSTMDCGPAALSCVLEGFRIPVSFGRLREACQTDVDGTSIDALETVAGQLGLDAEQVMLPPEHLFLRKTPILPAIVVVRHADMATHFVVVWRRLGNFLQVMDPSIGRRWVSCQRFANEIFQHEQRVLATDWRQWAKGQDFLAPLAEQLSDIGFSKANIKELLAKVNLDPLWFAPAALEASSRFVQSLIDADGLPAGQQAQMLATRLFEQTLASDDNVFKFIPHRYWSATAAEGNSEGALELLLRGAVILKVKRRSHATPAAPIAKAGATARHSPELAAATASKPAGPFTTIWGFLRQDGLLSPMALGGAAAIAAAVVLIELLLFRGLFELTNVLNLPVQRLAAVAGLLTMVALIMLIEVPMSSETMRMGRRLEVRLRMALLEKLPQLSDRYFQSRPVSDMADRSHNIHLVRMVPAFGLHFVGLTCDLAFTLTGIYFIDPNMMGLGLVLVVLAVVLPLLVQPFLNERDLRVRNHGAALHVFYLDALLGLVPIRTHRAERAVRRQHESLLVEWARSLRGFNRVSLSAGSAQALVCVGLAGYALHEHFTRSGFASGADLLLIFWTLKLPQLGSTFASMATQYPARRNVLLRLLEPLTTPADIITPPVKIAIPGQASTVAASAAAPDPHASRISVEHGSVVAAGHLLLHGVNLSVAPGEHVAIVGSSGAGKSTLLGLILGWHRLATGEMRVDGATLTPTSQEHLRRATAWVDPAIQLWNRSFLENLSYASDEGRIDAINVVLEATRLRRVLQNLPQGLQTYLGESGALLSGGEGQRLRLARAFMQTGVRLALLDEPFRGLDRQQRGQLLAEVRRWWQHATLLCVTHDVAETRSFDRVLVVENGRVVEDGAPADLASRPSRYRELLDAENHLRERIWCDPHWRHIRAADGLIAELESSNASLTVETAAVS